MHVTLLSKVLELAATLGYWTILWLLGRRSRPEGERDSVLMIEGPKPRTTVVIVRSEEGTDDVIVSVGVTR